VDLRSKVFPFPDPRVSQGFVDRYPFFRIHPQHLPEQVFGVIADILPPGTGVNVATTIFVDLD
jgi:hypothetical protein